MSYDSLSKHVILIAVFHILFYICYALAPVTNGIILKEFYNDASNNCHSMTDFNLLSVGFYMLMTIFAVLMIRGVVKQSFLLIAPWLIMSLFISLATAVVFMIKLITGDLEAFLNLANNLEIVDMKILIIYPTYTLYMRLVAKTLQQDSVATAVEKKVKLNDQYWSNENEVYKINIK